MAPSYQMRAWIDSGADVRRPKQNMLDFSLVRLGN
jgi:hypothetical protein